MEGIANFSDSIVYDNWADSDNLSAGYSVPPVQWEASLHDKYNAKGGWSVVGSTAVVSSWTPGRSPASMCSSGALSGWYQCNFNDINGTSRSGRIQTFKGAGSGSGEHAILKGTSTSAVFMSRGFLGPLTKTVASGKDALWLLGYPTGDSYWISGTQVRMNFQNGYGLYTPSTCASLFYYWADDIGAYLTHNPTDSCD